MADIRVSESSISLPFKINEFGSVATNSSQEKIWADRVRIAIGTNLGERVMRPGFGTEIPSLVLGDAERGSEVLKDQIRLAFTRDLSLLELSNIEVTFNDETGVMSVEIVYSLPNQQMQTVTMGFAKLSGNYPIIEETV
jgi:phage baseplate assembly protein W